MSNERFEIVRITDDMKSVRLACYVTPGIDANQAWKRLKNELEYVCAAMKEVTDEF